MDDQELLRQLEEHGIPIYRSRAEREAMLHPRRDVRWEKVQARIGPLPFDERFHTPKEIRQLELWLEFKIWVSYNGMYYWASQKVHSLDYEEFMANDPRVYGFILNELVDYIDREMVEHMQPPLIT